MKKILCILLAVALMASGCSSQKALPKFSYSFFDTFDTFIQIIGYCESEEEFAGHMQFAHEQYRYYHQLFDRFHEYEGVNNLATVNRMAGVAPVEVPAPLLDLVERAVQWGELSQGRVNIAFGPVTSIWQSYMQRYQGEEGGQLPDGAQLQQAALHTDLAKVQVDREASTLFLEEEGMLLDLGAVAKGYATEQVGQQLYDRGLTSLIISAGGNVRCFDPPRDGERAKWGIGIQDPDGDILDPAGTSLDVVFANQVSVVTSGDYQRYYLVDGQRVHHIIDTQTLYPAGRYRAVTVVVEDSATADMLSTALFCLDEEAGEQLAAQLGAQVLWVYADGSVRTTEGMLPYLRDRGGATGEK